MADVLATGAFLKSQNAFLGDRSPRTLKAYTLPGLAEEWSRMGIPSAEQIEYGKAFIPPLLASYMKAGARVGEYPALDRAFECIDYFTLLRIKDLNPLFERRYMGQGSRT
jgi:putative hemolysin